MYCDKPDVENDQIPNPEWARSWLDGRTYERGLWRGVKVDILRETSRKNDWIGKVEIFHWASAVDRCAKAQRGRQEICEHVATP